MQRPFVSAQASSLSIIRTGLVNTHSLPGLHEKGQLPLTKKIRMKPQAPSCNFRIK
jgi:hypothetical protein